LRRAQTLLVRYPIGETIRLSGRNLTENEHVKLGAYHTLEVELHRPFQLHKALWDALDLARIREACDPAASADLAAVLITVRSTREFGLGFGSGYIHDWGCFRVRG